MKKGLDIVWCSGCDEYGNQLHFCDLTHANVFRFISETFLNWIPCIPNNYIPEQNGYGINGNYNMLALNAFMERGVDRNNFIGSQVRWHSLELICQTYANDEPAPATYPDFISMDVLWAPYMRVRPGRESFTDLPSWDVFFSDATSDDRFSSDAMSFPNLLQNNTDYRLDFRILASHRISVPTSQDALGTTGVEAVADEATHTWCLKLPLEGLVSEFKFGIDGAIRGVEGVLLFIIRGSNSIVTNTPLVVATPVRCAYKARLFFYGGADEN